MRDIRKETGIVTKPAEGPETAVESPAIEKQAVEEHMAAADLSGPVAVALMRHNKWGVGRKIMKAEFDAALKKFRATPVGKV